jgi:hypothetical protein
MAVDVLPALAEPEVHGLEYLTAPGEAVGALDDDEAARLNDPAAMVAANPALSQYLDAERQRAVAAADQVRAQQAAETQRAQHLVQLAARADDGDVEARVALAGEVAGQQAAQAVYGQLFEEAAAATRLVAGGDAEAEERLSLRRFTSLGQWAQAIANEARRSAGAGPTFSGSGQWRSLAEAANLYAEDKISASEYEKAKAMWAADQLPAGSYD